MTKKKHLQILIKVILLFTLLLGILNLLINDLYWLDTISSLSRWFLVLICFGLMFFIKKNFLWKFIALLSITIIIGPWFVYNLHTYSSETDLYKNKLTILSYNVLFRSRDYKKIGELALSQDADIIAFQETTVQAVNTFNSILNKQQYPYKKLRPHPGGYGFAFYSKFPIEKEWILKNNFNRRIAQNLIVTANNKKVLFSNVHLASPAFILKEPINVFALMPDNHQARLEEWKILKQDLFKHEENIIVLGDFNSLEYEAIYRNIRKEFEDLHCFISNGPSFTFPTLLLHMIPIFKIDYIFFRGKLKARGFKVINENFSDHRPILGEILY